MVRDYQDMRVSQLFQYFWQEMRDGLKALPAWERFLLALQAARLKQKKQNIGQSDENSC